MVSKAPSPPLLCEFFLKQPNTWNKVKKPCKIGDGKKSLITASLHGFNFKLLIDIGNVLILKGRLGTVHALSPPILTLS